MKDQDKNNHYTVQTHFTSESGLTESMENYIEVISPVSYTHLTLPAKA